MYLLAQRRDKIQIILIFLILSYHAGKLHKHNFKTLLKLIFL
jgi:hypothetical protein